MTNEPGSPDPLCPDGDRAYDGPSSLDTAFDLLSTERRRRTLYCLRDADEPLSVTELAARVAEREADTVDADHRQRVAIALGQVHLPKLDDAGVVRYDPDDSHVEHDGGPLVETVLDWAEQLERR